MEKTDDRYQQIAVFLRLKCPHGTCGMKGTSHDNEAHLHAQSFMLDQMLAVGPGSISSDSAL